MNNEHLNTNRAYLMGTTNEQGMETAVVVIAKSIEQAEERNGSCKRLKVMDWVIEEKATYKEGDTWFLIERDLGEGSNIVLLRSGSTMTEALSKTMGDLNDVQGIDTLEFNVLI